jgi:putative transposase
MLSSPHIIPASPSLDYEVPDRTLTEGGAKIGEVCRQLGVAEQTYFRWKRQYGGLGVSELRELRQLRDENSSLKRLVADLSLDKRMLQEVLAKKV